MKYPPIQGGVSAQSYWLCRSLAEAGQQVDVVTCADEVADSERMSFVADDERMLEGRWPGGGSVTVHQTPNWPDQLTPYVPYANPLVSKLATTAAEVVRSQRSDVIFAWYLEPNGVAANLVSAWTGVPFVLQTAGSDRIRMMDWPELSLAYKEVFRSASAILGSIESVAPLGISRSAVHKHPEGPILPSAFAVRAPVAAGGLPDGTDSVARIGVYGKAGLSRGTYDLLEVLAKIRSKGSCFELALMIGGPEREDVLRGVHELGLRDVTVVLPFVPHWRVPHFIHSCVAVCALENGFDVAEHASAQPSEVLACGRLLIVSHELAGKQTFTLRDGENSLVVDPRDHEDLARALNTALLQPDEADRIATAGSRLVSRADPAIVAAGYRTIFESALGAAPRWRPASATRTTTASGVTLVWKRAPYLAALYRSRPPLHDALEAELEDRRARLPYGRESSRGGDAKTLAMAPVVQAAWATVVSADQIGPAERDLALLELGLLWLEVDFEGSLGIEAFGHGSVAAGMITRADLVSAETVPISGATSGLIPVAIDVRRALEWLRGLRRDHRQSRQLDTAEFAGGRQWCMFNRSPSLNRRAYAVHGEVARAMLLCDGTRRVADIAAEMSELETSQVERVVGDLVSCGVLGFRRSQSRTDDRRSWFLADAGPFSE